jgi:hypothetical protein
MVWSTLYLVPSWEMVLARCLLSYLTEDDSLYPYIEGLPEDEKHVVCF